MVATPNTQPLDTAPSSPQRNRRSSGRLIVHVLLLIYGLVVAYVVGGLLLPYNVNPDIFFGLSIALLFFALGQSIYEIGIRKAFLFFVITSIVGFGVEVLGTNTGLPFGKYSYGDFLGEKVFGVPIVVPLVWFVISYITFSITFSSRLHSNGLQAKLKLVLPSILLASFGAVAWDFMVDPMFSTYGYWTWQTPLSTPSLSGVPLSNFLGWFVVAFLMILIFVAVSRSLGSSHISSLGPIRRIGNTIDSKIAYVLLMIDGAVANVTLGPSHYLAAVIGVLAMCSFLFLTMGKFGTVRNLSGDISYKAAQRE